MGNDANCSRLCEKKSDGTHNNDDILLTEYIVPCQICNQQFKHQALKHHIDLIHYATIKEQNDGQVAVECLLCRKVTSDLLEHDKHIESKHLYAHSGKSNKSKPTSEVTVENLQEGKTVSEGQLNKSKKKMAVRLSSQRDFQIIRQIETNHYEAAVYGIKYDVFVYVKEYRGADYQEQLAEAQVIWFNAFKKKNKVKFYFFDIEPRQRSIICKGYLFTLIQ